MLLLSQTLCWDLATRRAWEEGKELCVRKSMSSHALCFPFRLYEEGSPSPCAKYVPLEGEKREQTGDFIQDTIFHQVLLLLQETLYPKVSATFVFLTVVLQLLSPSREVWDTLPPLTPHADREVSSSPRREGEAGGHQQGHAWGLCLGPPAAMRSWNLQHVRSLEARQGGQLLPLLAVGSNSCLLYKTHQNFISMRNPSAKQGISFVSVRTAKSLDSPQTDTLQAESPSFTWQSLAAASPAHAHRAGPKGSPMPGTALLGQTQVPWQASRLWTVYKNYHVNVPQSTRGIKGDGENRDRL